MFKFFVLTFFCFNVFANTINLANDESYSECQYEPKTEEFFCEDSTSKVYVRNDNFGSPVAIKYSKKNDTITINELESIQTYDDDYYFYQDPRFLPDPDAEILERYEGRYVETQKYSEFFKRNNEFLKSNSAFKKEVAKIVEIASERIKKNDDVKKEDLIVKIDGKDQVCKRDPLPYCSLLTCQNLPSKDIYYLQINDSSSPSFITYPSPTNSDQNYLPEINQLSSKDGEVLISIKEYENEKLIRGGVPSYFRNNPDLFSSYFSLNDASLEFHTRQCKNLPKNLAKDIFKKLKFEFENAKMINYVEYINNSLDGILVNPEYLPEITCYYKGSYYTPQAYKELEKALVSESSVISLEKANELIKKARARKDIAWNVKLDGCYARAHLMSRMFEAEGVKVEKAWARGSLQIPGIDGARWGYHVAPSVLVKDKDGKITKMIIDPSISNKPLSPEVWLSKMGVKKEQIKQSGYPSAVNSQMYNQVSLSYSTPDAYFPHYNDINEVAKMSMARKTMYQYLNTTDEELMFELERGSF